MNVVGIIAEYNPMHNGHIYNIKKAKELSSADYAIVIMSGSFTQQGNIAVINKLDRAKIAIENGADLVIELPAIYATSSAETFAFGAVNILNSLNVVTHLAFGAESDDLCDLTEVATSYITNKENIIKKSKEYIKLGINSADSYSKAMQEYTNISCDIYSKPNNILAIEYIKALLSLKSQIKPVLIHREDSCHNDKEISYTRQYISSTSIRNVLSNQNLPIEDNLKCIESFIPKNTYLYLTTNTINYNENLWNILKYEIIKLNINGLVNIQEITEGLENKIYNQALLSKNYNEFIFGIKSKRYTLSKIKRICIYIILGITKEKYNKLKNVNYTRILKVKKSSLELLSIISKKSKNCIFTKITDDNIKSIDDNIKESIQLDILSNNLFNLPNIDYTNQIIQS